MSSVLKAFNNHLIEFLDDIISIFPNNLDIRTGKTFIEGVKKVNPKSLILFWKESILDLYEDQIENGDSTFFLNKDYHNDLGEDKTNRALEVINDIKKLVKETSQKNKDIAMKYILNLTKLCKLYFNN